MWYCLFGWWYRWQACKMAAQVFSNRQHQADDAMSPLIWSVTVFFEQYMTIGAGGTAEDFGPKEPTELKIIPNKGARP